MSKLLCLSAILLVFAIAGTEGNGGGYYGSGGHVRVVNVIGRGHYRAGYNNHFGGYHRVGRYNGWNNGWNSGWNNGGYRRVKSGYRANRRPTPPVINPSLNCTRNGETFREDRCDRYWKCVGGEAQLRLCPKGKLFDTDFLICVKAKQANCVPIIATTITTNGPTSSTRTTSTTTPSTTTPSTTTPSTTTTSTTTPSTTTPSTTTPSTTTTSTTTPSTTTTSTTTPSTTTTSTTTPSTTTSSTTTPSTTTSSTTTTTPRPLTAQ